MCITITPSTPTLLPLQCGFLIWCMMPIANNGSMFIYQRIIRPFVVKHEKTLDAAFDSATQLAKDAGKSGRQHLSPRSY